MDGLTSLAAVLKQFRERPAVHLFNILQEIAENEYVPG